jgi:arginase
MKSLAILEFPTNLGLKPLRPGHDPGVRKLPAWLREHGFHAGIHPLITKNLPAPEPSGQTDATTGVRNTDQLIEYAMAQQVMLADALSNDYFPVILGGDCSIVIGNMLALKQAGRFGLFYLDGHTDFIGPAISTTAGAAGMCLAIVAGEGHDRLTNIDHLKPYVDQKHIWCVGNRENDRDYVQPILNSAVSYFDLKELRRTGPARCVDYFLSMVHTERLDGFLLHLDVDVLNDSIMPAVDSRSPDGLAYPELKEILTPLIAKATAIEITILDPDLDPDAQYTKAFITTFIEIIAQVRKA